VSMLVGKKVAEVKKVFLEVEEVKGEEYHK
jgi:hypothetical protein